MNTSFNVYVCPNKLTVPVDGPGTDGFSRFATVVEVVLVVPGVMVSGVVASGVVASGVAVVSVVVSVIATSTVEVVSVMKLASGPEVVVSDDVVASNVVND